MRFPKNVAASEVSVWIGVQWLLDLSWMIRDRASYTRSNMSIDYATILNGVGCAPEQYRIGVLSAANLLHHWTRLSIQQWINASDLVCCLLTSLVLCRLLQRILLRSGWSAAYRTLAFALLALADLFYLHWCLYLIRPETTVSILFACLTLYLLDGAAESGSKGRRAAILLALAGLAVVQSFCRPDVPLAIGVGELAVGTILFAGSTGLSRGFLSAAGLMTAGAAGCIQLYLSRVRYPGHHYCGPTFVLVRNLAPVALLLLTVLILPFVLTSVGMARRWASLPAPARVGLMASAVHFGMFLSLGNSDETRIFVPLLMAMAPWSAYEAAMYFRERAG